jgi:hypothetical protein
MLTMRKTKNKVPMNKPYNIQNTNYQKIVEKDFIYHNLIAIKWGESTHFPGRNDPGRIEPGRTGNRGETTKRGGAS